MSMMSYLDHHIGWRHCRSTILEDLIAGPPSWISGHINELHSGEPLYSSIGFHPRVVPLNDAPWCDRKSKMVDRLWGPPRWRTGSDVIQYGGRDMTSSTPGILLSLLSLSPFLITFLFYTLLYPLLFSLCFMGPHDQPTALSVTWPGYVIYIYIFF